MARRISTYTEKPPLRILSGELKKTTTRQTVLSGRKDVRGHLNFIQQSEASLDLKASEAEPLVVSFANGTSDSIKRLAADVTSAWPISTTGRRYYYIELNAGGEISFGYSNVQPTYQYEAPEPTVPLVSLLPKMTSDNTPGPYVVSASSIYGVGYEAFRAFEKEVGDSTGTWGYWYSSSVESWLQIDLGPNNAEVVKEYRLTPYQHAPWAHTPKDWTFEGSNDGGVWTALHTVTDFYFSSIESERFSIDNITAYRYYRLNITATSNGGATVLDELELMIDGEPETMEGRHWFDLSEMKMKTHVGGEWVPVLRVFVGESLATTNSARIPLAMTSNSAPSGFSASASGTYAAGYEPFRAFDGADVPNGSPGGCWVSGMTAGPHYLQVKLNTSRKVVKYRIVGDQYQWWDTAPKQWVLRGSTNGTTWVDLDTRTNVDWSGTPSMTKDFEVSSPGSYMYYRLANMVNGGYSTGQVDISEVVLFEELAPTINVTTYSLGGVYDSGRRLFAHGGIKNFNHGLGVTPASVKLYTAPWAYGGDLADWEANAITEITASSVKVNYTEGYDLRIIAERGW